MVRVEGTRAFRLSVKSSIKCRPQTGRIQSVLWIELLLHRFHHGSVSLAVPQAVECRHLARTMERDKRTTWPCKFAAQRLKRAHKRTRLAFITSHPRPVA